jgi:hypothetical protein
MKKKTQHQGLGLACKRHFVGTIDQVDYAHILWATQKCADEIISGQTKLD